MHSGEHSDDTCLHYYILGYCCLFFIGQKDQMGVGATALEHHDSPEIHSCMKK